MSDLAIPPPPAGYTLMGGDIPPPPPGYTVMPATGMAEMSPIDAPAEPTAATPRPTNLRDRLQPRIDALKTFAADPLGGAVNPIDTSALGQAASNIYRPLSAALQNTSPHLGAYGAPLGELVQSDSGPSVIDPQGKLITVDPNQHAVLQGDNDKMMVYQRTPQSDESRASSLGRVLGFGMLAPAEAPMQIAEQAPSQAQNLLKDFEAQGVDPSLPAISQSRGAGIAQTALHEGPASADVIAGGVKSRLGQTAQAAERAAEMYGDAASEKQAGDVIQESVNRFAGKPDIAAMTPEQIIAAPTRNVGLQNKAAALFDRLGGQFSTQEQIPLTETLQALKGPVERFPTAPELGQSITNPTLQKYYGILQEKGALTFPEIKEFRSYIGRQLDSHGIGPDSIPQGDLKNVYGALTKDIGAAAEAKGPQAASAFKQSNAYYSAAQDRIAQLQKFVGKTGQTSPESAYGALVNAAQSGTRGDINRLYAVRRAVPTDQWGDIASAAIRTMGRGAPSAADAVSGPTFSVNSFLTNYSKLSDAGKDVIFSSAGMGPLRENLDQLARVIGAQKNVEKLANVSGTSRVAGMTGAYAAFTHSPVLTSLGLAGSNIAARAIMNPTFVRWLYSGPKTSAMEPWAAHLGQLDQLAANDKTLAPIADYLHQNLAPAYAAPSDSGRPTKNNIAPPIR